jgi:hypothetical protein
MRLVLGSAPRFVSDGNFCRSIFNPTVLLLPWLARPSTYRQASGKEVEVRRVHMSNRVVCNLL